MFMGLLQHFAQNVSKNSDVFYCLFGILQRQLLQEHESIEYKMRVHLQTQGFELKFNEQTFYLLTFPVPVLFVLRQNVVCCAVRRVCAPAHVFLPLSRLPRAVPPLLAPTTNNTMALVQES